MNLLKAQDLLKGVPDAKLAELTNNPQGDIPPFLVAAEAARRSKVRQEYSANMQGKAPSSTVMEDLMNNLGLANLKPPGQQQVAMQAPQMPAAPQQPVQMYDGGIVAFAEGGMPRQEDLEGYLNPEAGGSESGFGASIAPYIPGLEGRVRAGVLGSANPKQPTISGYQIGYEDGKNAALASIIPTPMGNIANAEYRRQLGDDSEIALRGSLSPFKQMASDFRQAPLSIEYTKRFADGGIASFASGGESDMYKYMPDYASNISIPDLPGFESFMSQVQGGFGESELPKYRKEISEERERLQKEAPTGISSLLKNIGQGLVASKQRGFVGAFSEGISAGISMQDAAEQKHKEAMRQLRTSEVEVAQKERAEKMGQFGLAKQLEDSAVNRRNSAITQNQQAAQLALTGRRYEDEAKEAAARLLVDKERLGVEREKVAFDKSQRGQLTPRDVIGLSTDIYARLSSARENLDKLYKDASENPNHWYSLEKERINSLPTNTERQVALQRLRQGLERDYGITGLKSRLQSLESVFSK